MDVFKIMSPIVFRALQSVTGCYRVLQSVTEYHRVGKVEKQKWDCSIKPKFFSCLMV